MDLEMENEDKFAECSDPWLIVDIEKSVDMEEDNTRCYSESSEFDSSEPSTSAGEKRDFDQSFYSGVMESETVPDSQMKKFKAKEEAFHIATPLDAEAYDSYSMSTKFVKEELQRLENFIQVGNTVAFAHIIWSDPLLLINDDFLPLDFKKEDMMQCNVLHVAAQFDKPDICALLLDTLENEEFYQKRFPYANIWEIRRRMRLMLDLYLNNSHQDTPLHSAARYGSVDCARVISSHPACDRRVMNCDLEIPINVICSHCGPVDEKIKVEIKSCIKSDFYVTVLKAKGNCPVIIGTPCQREDVVYMDGWHPMLEQNFYSDDPQSEKFYQLPIRSLAGPMSEEMALKFCALLKNPSSSEVCAKNPALLKTLYTILHYDTEKGAERLARVLTSQLNVNWQEYFPALGMYVDMSKFDGLNALENFFQEKEQNKPHFKPPVGAVESLAAVYIAPKAHINPLVHDMNVFLKREQWRYRTGYINSKDVGPFIDGSYFSRVDVDFLLAMGNNIVDKKFPLVMGWKNSVEMKLKQLHKENMIDLFTPMAFFKIPHLLPITEDAESATKYADSATSKANNSCLVS